MDGAQTGSSTLDKNGPGSDANEGVLRIPRSSSHTGDLHLYTNKQHKLMLIWKCLYEKLTGKIVIILNMNNT